MNSKIELIASYWTLAGAAPPHSDREWSTFEFKERVEAAARAGFKGIGFWHSDLEHVLQTRSLAEMKRILDGSGMQHVEIEVLEDWFVEGERRQRSDARKKFLFEAAEALGARHIKAVDFFVGAGKYPTSRLVDEFGALCREADARGIRIACEIIPFSAVGTLEIARALVEGARPRNGGVIFDLSQSRSTTATSRHRPAWSSARRSPITASCAVWANSTSRASWRSWLARPTEGRWASKF